VSPHGYGSLPDAKFFRDLGDNLSVGVAVLVVVATAKPLSSAAYCFLGHQDRHPVQTISENSCRPPIPILLGPGIFGHIAILHVASRSNLLAASAVIVHQRRNLKSR
jgi:hypothetical protein